MNLEFYNGKKVFITGHTGFKGSWMCKVLETIGANVCGYSLEPHTQPNLFSISEIEKNIKSVIGDIRDLEHLKKAMNEFEPEIVIHMAAQPLVKESYEAPVYTYEVNVMGTVHILEAVRQCKSVKSFVNVTTDKVYKNNEWEWGYRETDELDGYDPYSNSKSCSELVTSAYLKSFFKESNRVAISTLRAGNVIGGGDFADNRIIPDCIRAASVKKDIVVRNPYSIRPYQHVLEPIMAYLKLAQLQYEDKDRYQGSYNIGPNDEDCVTTGKLATIFCEKWGQDIQWINVSEKNAHHEANFLKLDCSKIKTRLGWSPKWNIEQAVEKTVEFAKAYYASENISEYMTMQIKEYIG